MKNRFKPGLAVTFLFSLLSMTPAHSLEIEIDPVPFWLKGYSFSLSQHINSDRFSMGFFKVEADEDIHGNKHFDMEFEGVGIKYDYLFHSYDGFFIGWELNVAEVTYTHTSSNDVFERTLVTTAPRLGYRFVNDNNFTITPWLALDILLYEGKRVESDGDTFDNETVQLFPSIHFGYLF